MQPPETDLPLSLTQVDYSEGLAFIALMALLAFWIVFSNLRKMYEVRQREQTRREIAAYVAEGTITPADARMMFGTDESEFEKKIAEAVSWGMLSTKKAEQLMKAMRENRAAKDQPGPTT